MDPPERTVGEYDDHIARLRRLDEVGYDGLDVGKRQGTLAPLAELLCEHLDVQLLGNGELRAPHRGENDLVSSVECSHVRVLVKPTACRRATWLEHSQQSARSFLFTQATQGLADGAGVVSKVVDDRDAAWSTEDFLPLSHPAERGQGRTKRAEVGSESLGASRKGGSGVGDVVPTAGRCQIAPRKYPTGEEIEGHALARDERRGREPMHLSVGHVVAFHGIEGDITAR